MEISNPIHIYSDRRYFIDFAARDKDGADLDWSSYTNKSIHFVVKRNPDDDDSDAKIHKSTTLGITDVSYNPVTGTIELTTANTAQTNLPNGKYHWELVFQCDEIGPTLVDYGVMQVTESPTKDISSLPAAS